MKRTFAALFIMTLALAGCGSDAGGPYVVRYAPKTATNVVDEGNGWVSFTSHGKRYLLHCGNNTPAIEVKE